MHHRLGRGISALLFVICALCPVACSASLVPTVIDTEHEYVLARFEGETLMVVEDDDPLYGRFEVQVLSDPYLSQLVTLFDDATQAFWATNTLTSFSQTVDNKLVIVVNGSQVEVMHDVVMEDGGTRIPIELALGLGHEGEVDLAQARRHFAPTMAGLLWELMGLPPSDAPPVPLYETTEPSVALERGFQVAIETLHEEHAAQRSGKARSARHALVSQNAFRRHFVDGAPGASMRPPTEALRTPGVTATFFYRLLQRTNAAYPQRYMLWFTNYEGANVAHGKILYALGRTPGCGRLSAQHFIEAYGETFPSEREMILSLAEEVFGQSASAAHTIPSGSR